jgi:hypothetical protein
MGLAPQNHQGSWNYVEAEDKDGNQKMKTKGDKNNNNLQHRGYRVLSPWNA